MAEIIKMPRLSDTMEEGKVEVWHKKIGDKINYGDIIAEIETDKAIQEFESDIEGTLLYIGVQEGESAAVESILAVIGNKGEDISNLINIQPETKEINSDDFNKKEIAEELPEIKIPDNVTIINMPRLSDTMEEGKIETWHKKVGDKVNYGDIIAEIETDKAVQEFESDVEGTLLYIGVKEGISAPIDTILAIIGDEGTDISNIISMGNNLQNKKLLTNDNKTDIKPKEQVEEVTKITPIAQGRIFISPLAKKIAKEKGYNISEIKGSGDNGRITKKDVENFVPKSIKTLPENTTKTINTPIHTAETKRVENSKMRKVIAKRLSESKFTAPHYYLNIEVDMGNVFAARKEINTIGEAKISFNDIVVKAVAMALRKHPQVNSTWTDNEIITHGDINIGIAVAVTDGLLVPVVRNTDNKSLSQISSEIIDLAKRSRDRKIKADEMEGSTFTVSNLGSYGIESFTSIINQPNSCILSVGAILDKPIVKNGQIVPGKIMKLSMACDHRTVDGATGSLYLQTLKQYLETPMAMFL